MKINFPSKGKKKILYIAPIAPPSGGIASWMQQIQDNGLTCNDWCFSVVNSAMLGRSVGQKRNISSFFFDIVREVRIFSNFIARCLFKKIDIIHNSSGLGVGGIYRDITILVFAKLFKIPYIYHSHCDLKFVVKKIHSNRVYFLVARKLLVLIFKNADFHFVLTDDSYRIISAFKNKKFIKLMPNPIFLEKIKINDLLKFKKFTITYVGAIIDAKGSREFYSVARTFPEIDFLMIGSSLDKYYLDNKPENIRYLGVLSNLEVLKRLYESTLFLFLSHTEGFPVSVLEAMSVGLPVIATKVGAIPTMIDDQFGGFLVDVGDVVYVASLISKYLHSPRMILEHGNYNKLKVMNNFSYHKVISDMINTYNFLQ